MYTYIFGYFSNSKCEEIYIYIYIYNLLKKCCRNGFGLLPNCIGKKNCIATLQLYCNLAIVLQERGLEKKNCIAIVLQEKGVVGLG